MSSFMELDSLTGETVHGFSYPLEDATAGGGFPSVSSWRQWGHSWAASGFDDEVERHRSRVSERIAGVMHLPPHAVANEAVSGAAVMDALGSGAIGFGRVLQRCVSRSKYQQWPWEVDRFGVECAMWGVNDIGTGGIHNSGLFWPQQAAMWNLVWGNTMRSVIQRFIAGAIYVADGTGLSAPIWRGTVAGSPPTGPAADFNFLPKGPGGVGTGSWVFKVDNRANSGGGYWYTPANGDTMVITVPVDFDTGRIAIRHFCPGSWFDGPTQQRDPFGNPGTAGGTPNPLVYTGAEHPRAANAVTVAIPGQPLATVDCRGLANRINGAGAAPGVGAIGAPGAMTHVSRHAVTPTPGDTQTVTLTVGGLAAGNNSWYGFDSWEIEAKPELRPIVIMANVADPASWVPPSYFFTPQTVWALASARAQDYSQVLATVCAEFDDPGIMVADIRTKIATHPKDYGILLDSNLAPSNVMIGDTVEISSHLNPAGTLVNASGDGTHPHAMGERLIIEAMMDALAQASLPRSRAAMPFAPGRGLAYARSSGG